MIIGQFSAITEGQISKMYDYRGILFAISISQMALFYTHFLFANFATWKIVTLKIFPTMLDNYKGILNHLRRENLKIFSNHGECL